MGVDQGRDDRLAAQAHASRAGRHLHVTRSTDLRKTTTIDDERGVLDGRSPVADDEPRSFDTVTLRAPARKVVSTTPGHQVCRQQQSDNGHQTRLRVCLAHRKPPML